MTHCAITYTGLRLEAPEDPPRRDELDHPDFTHADGSRRWEIWDAPQDWDCQFMRHRETDLLYHPDDGYLIGWLHADAALIDLFDSPLEGCADY